MNGHICYFFVILLYIEKKWLLVRHLATVLPLKSILFGKFQRVNMKIDASKCWKIVEFQKILIKMKDCNTFYEAQANFICLQNSKIVLWNKWSSSLDFVGIETFCQKIWKLKNSSDDVHWNVWTNIKTLHARNNISKKKKKIGQLFPHARLINTSKMLGKIAKDNNNITTIAE